MPLSRNTKGATREKTRRKSIRAGKENPLVLSLSCRSSCANFTTIEGTQDVEGLGHIKTNLTLLDKETSLPILQRFSPTSLDQRAKAVKSAAKGLELFNNLQDAYTPKGGRGLYHLGIWHSTGNGYLGLTEDTKNTKAAFHSMPLLRWAKHHSESFLSSLKPLMHPHYQDQLAKRKQPKKWLEAIHDDAKTFLHPWWTTVSFFNTFTEKEHKDKADTQPSFLFNFGGPCLLKLHEYKVQIQVDAFDVVVFNTATIEHSTHKLEGSVAGERWAFSAFFRESVFEKKPLKQVAEERLKKVDEKEGPSNRKRVRYTS